MNYSGEHEGAFSDVPNEILEEIFSCFHSGRDLLSTACVTKRWNIVADRNSLWQALYLFHWEKPLIPLKPFQNWKNLFMKHKSEILLSQISKDRESYARRKKGRPTNLNIDIRKSNDRVEVPRATWRPEKNITDNDTGHAKKQNDRKRKRNNAIKDDQLDDLLEERKQFFNSIYTTSLATTPMKPDTFRFTLK